MASLPIPETHRPVITYCKHVSMDADGQTRGRTTCLQKIERWPR
jgi:hypothetical protein